MDNFPISTLRYTFFQRFGTPLGLKTTMRYTFEASYFRREAAWLLDFRQNFGFTFWANNSEVHLYLHLKTPNPQCFQGFAAKTQNNAQVHLSTMRYTFRIHRPLRKVCEALIFLGFQPSTKRYTFGPYYTLLYISTVVRGGLKKYTETLQIARCIFCRNKIEYKQQNF